MKKNIGRPKLPVSESLSKVFQLRLCVDDWKAIGKAASQKKITPSEFIRISALQNLTEKVK